jgi:hypothetical protein
MEAHILRMGKMRNACKVLHGIPEETIWKI